MLLCISFPRCLLLVVCVCLFSSVGVQFVFASASSSLSIHTPAQVMATFEDVTTLAALKHTWKQQPFGFRQQWQTQTHIDSDRQTQHSHMLDSTHSYAHTSSQPLSIPHEVVTESVEQIFTMAGISDVHDDNETISAFKLQHSSAASAITISRTQAMHLSHRTKPATPQQSEERRVHLTTALTHPQDNRFEISSIPVLTDQPNIFLQNVTDGSLSLADADSDESFGAYARVPWKARQIDIRGDFNDITADVMEAMYLLYNMIRPDVFLSGSPKSNTETLQALAAGTVDFAITASLTVQNRVRAMPDIVSIPIVAFGCVPVANIPGTYDTQLTLDVLTMCRILTGNITRWNDPSLVALNPSFPMPSEDIVMGTISISNSCANNIGFACASVWPEYVRILGAPSSTPKWAYNRYARYLPHVSAAGAVATALDSGTPYYFTFGSAHDVQKLGAKSFSLLNPHGKKVVATLESVQFALQERLIFMDGNTRSFRMDLTNAPGENAWPLTGLAVLYMAKNFTRDLCYQKAEAAKFWLWLLNSPMTSWLVARSHQMLLPDVMQDQLDTDSNFRTLLYCENGQINTGDLLAQSIYGSEIWSFYNRVFGLLLSAYERTLALYSFELVPSQDYDTITSMSTSSDKDFGLLTPDIVRVSYPGLLENLTQSADARFFIFPLALYPILPTYHLPPAVETIRQRSSKTYKSFHLDLETLAQIWLGNVRSWDDPRIEAMNPGLTDAYVESGLDPSITLVFCHNTSNAVYSITNSFIKSLYTTNSFSEPGAPAQIYPVNWDAFIKRYKSKGMKYLLIDNESQLEISPFITPGSMSYRLMDDPDPDHTVDIEISYQTGNKSYIPLSADIQSTYKCMRNFPPEMQNRDVIINDYISGREGLLKGCWPFMIYQGIMQQKQYLGYPCSRGRETIKMSNFLLTDDSLTGLLEKKSIARFSEIPIYETLLRQALDTVTCDGEPMLIRLPVDWKLSSGVYAIGVLLTVFGWLSCLISVYLYRKFRSTAIVRSASIPFQLLTLLGNFLFFTLPLIIVSPVSTSSCSAFIWIVFLAFSITFSPLFMKMYRIYMIFGRKELKVVRLTNKMLLMGVAALVGVQIILLIASQANAPLVPGITSDTNSDGLTTRYQTCNLQTDSIGGFYALLAFNGLLVCFGMFVGIRTRNVASQFNESKNIALSLYNVIVTGGIIIAAIFLIGAKGDSLILLLLILFSIIAWVTLLLTSVTKFVHIFMDEKKKKSLATNLTKSHMTQASNFTDQMNVDIKAAAQTTEFVFPSIERFENTRQIDRYINALERQIRHARKRCHVEGAKGNQFATRSRLRTSMGAALSRMPDDVTSPKGNEAVSRVGKAPEGSAPAPASSRPKPTSSLRPSAPSFSLAVQSTLASRKSTNLAKSPMAAPIRALSVSMVQNQVLSLNGIATTGTDSAVSANNLEEDLTSSNSSRATRMNTLVPLTSSTSVTSPQQSSSASTSSSTSSSSNVGNSGAVSPTSAGLATGSPVRSTNPTSNSPALHSLRPQSSSLAATVGSPLNIPRATSVTTSSRRTGGASGVRTSIPVHFRGNSLQHLQIDNGTTGNAAAAPLSPVQLPVATEPLGQTDPPDDLHL